MSAPLGEKLKNVRRGEFKMGDLFEIQHTLSFNKSSLTAGDKYDYVTRTSLNQGILQTTGFVNKENLNPAGIWSLGLLQMDFFYRKNPWYAGQFVRKIIPKIQIPKNAIMYFSAVLNKQKDKLLSVLVRDVDKTFCNLSLDLPITSNGEIDFSFMETFIRELEEERIRELAAYLTASGLTDYHLTPPEIDIIYQFDKTVWGTFNLEELYGKSTRGKRLKSADRIPGKLIFVTAGEANEGISTYIGNSVKVFSKNTTTIDMFGSAKYRNYDYGADDHVAVVHTENLPKYASIFVTSAIHKAAHTGKFSYAKNFYAKDADELNISLPIKDGAPDYTFMATFIRAVQKLVIKNVVRYTDKKISAYKQVSTQ